MRKEYDLSKLKLRKNPYAKRLKQQITIRLDKETVNYFKQLADDTGIAYQLLINLYLKDCATSRKKPSFKWDEAA